eukprot:scaffold961_cov122-Cylindrotheca_fusiformis.AAC.27
MNQRWNPDGKIELTDCFFPAGDFADVELMLKRWRGRRVLEIFGPLAGFSWFNDDEFIMVVICFVGMENGCTNYALQIGGEWPHNWCEAVVGWRTTTNGYLSRVLETISLRQRLLCLTNGHRV